MTPDEKNASCHLFLHRANSPDMHLDRRHAQRRLETKNPRENRTRPHFIRPVILASSGKPRFLTSRGSRPDWVTDAGLGVVKVGVSEHDGEKDS